MFYCTVTCRQFLNLTFAPRKTFAISKATSRFTAINVTTYQIIHEVINIRKYFCNFFPYKFDVFFQQKLELIVHYAQVPYLFPNAIHFSSSKQQVFAYRLLQALEN